MPGASLAETVAEVARQAGFSGGSCRVALGADQFFIKNLKMPFGERQQIEKILPFELEEQTSHRVGELHLDFLVGPKGEEGGEILAAMIEKERFADLLSQLVSQGIDPELFTVGGPQIAGVLAGTLPEAGTVALLDIGLRRTTFTVIEEGRVVLVRSLAVIGQREAGFAYQSETRQVEVADEQRIPQFAWQLGLAVIQTLKGKDREDLLKKKIPCFVSGAVGLLPLVFESLDRELELEVRVCDLADQPLVNIEASENGAWNSALMNGALALALSDRNPAAIINFRRGDFKKRISLKKYRHWALAAAASLGVIVVVVVGLCWWNYATLQHRQDALRSQINAVFHSTLPEVTRVVDPVQQLRVKIDQTRKLYQVGSHGRGNSSMLALLAEISSRIPESLQLHITRLVADQDSIRIRGETKDFNIVDSVQKDLEKSPYFESVVISSANLAPQGGEVRFELRLQLRK